LIDLGHSVARLQPYSSRARHLKGLLLTIGSWLRIGCKGTRNQVIYLVQHLKQG
jgi:hypothetical protein